MCDGCEDVELTPTLDLLFIITQINLTGARLCVLYSHWLNSLKPILYFILVTFLQAKVKCESYGYYTNTYFIIGKEKPPNSVSYLKLTNIDGTIIADKTHNIPSYKPGKSLDEPIPNLKGTYYVTLICSKHSDCRFRSCHGEVASTR